MNSRFFWSEEHAREFRAAHQSPDGRYVTLGQSAISGKIGQSALFDF